MRSLRPVFWKGREGRSFMKFWCFGGDVLMCFKGIFIIFCVWVS